MNIIKQIPKISNNYPKISQKCPKPLAPIPFGGAYIYRSYFTSPAPAG